MGGSEFVTSAPSDWLGDGGLGSHFMRAPTLLSSARIESASTRLMPAGRSVTSKTRPVSGGDEDDDDGGG